MCDNVVSNDPFMVKYCLDWYKTQGMCDKAVDDLLPAVKFVTDLFVRSKVIKKLDGALFNNDDMTILNEGG